MISAISRAISAPSEIAMPTSAAESAGGIVDAVSDHDNLASGCLFTLDKTGFILRKHLGIILVHTDALCDGACRPLAVTRHHDDLLDTGAAQGIDNCLRLLTERIFNTDHGCKLSLDGQIQMGILLRQALEQFLRTPQEGQLPHPQIQNDSFQSRLSCR